MIEPQQVANGESCAPESGVPGSDRRRHDSQYGQYRPDFSQQGVGDFIHHPGGVPLLRHHHLAQLPDAAEEAHADRRPDKGHDPLDDHRPVKYFPSLLLVFHAAGHQGRLRGMETGYGAAGYGDEQHGENGEFLLVVMKVLPVPGGQLRDGIAFDYQGDHQAYSHEQQGKSENRIDFSDNLVDGQQGRQDIIDEDGPNPEPEIEGGGCQAGEDTGGARNKNDSHKHQQHYREHPHQLPCRIPQIDADDFGYAQPVVPHREHAREIVVHRPRKHGSKNDPHERDGPPQRSGNGTEDGTQTGNIQELNKENAPPGHRNEVDPVTHGYGRGRPPGVGFHQPFQVSGIKNVTG